jgi:hypothetical protein
MKITAEQRITNSKNMVEVTQIVLTDVWAQFALKFKEEVRPFIRAKETQENWIKSVNETFGVEMYAERKRLFKLIPSQLEITNMYKELDNRLKN